EWLGLLHVATFALVTIHCLMHRREPTSALLWMFVVWAFPLIGPVCFLMFGINRIPTKAWRKYRSDEKFLTERRAREHEEKPLAYWRSVRASVATEPPQPELRNLNALMNAVVPDYPLLGHNHVEAHVTGDVVFPRMLAAIRGAKHHIHLQTYILGHDEIGREFLEALRERANAGVTVRLLYDRIGSAHAWLFGLFSRYTGIPNLHLAAWAQVNPLKLRFQVNLRNHRKVLIVDGEHAFMGGINLSVNNVTRNRRPPDRDYHFELRGPIVPELQYAFLSDWYFMTDAAPESLLCVEHFPRPAHAGNSLIRLLNGGPSTQIDEMIDTTFAAITSAQKSITVVTPYFVPPTEILCAFRSAALRGVQVTLILPKVNNHIYAGLAGRSIYDDLLKAGVRIFERPPPFIHAKAMLIDESLAIVGTANLDVRSLRLNYETNLAVFDPDFIDSLRAIVREDLAASHEINRAAWVQRPRWRQVLENFCSLLTPIL
ncbi:MAG: cardiolipin synthase, partial [Verrucomicrobia bacterium]|nr:cardiolipin synthase [Verrucomicrobiota bacterium]